MNSRALALSWIWKARDIKSKSFHTKTIEIQTEVEKLLKKMPAAEDWYFTSELRVRGASLREQSLELLKQEEKVNSEIEQKILRLNQDLNAFIQEKNEAMENEKKLFEELNLKEKTEEELKLNASIDSLKEKIESKVKEFAEAEEKAIAENGIIPLTKAMQNEHKAHILNMKDEMEKERIKIQSEVDKKLKEKRDAFNAELKLTETAINNRKGLAAHRIFSIKKENIRNKEIEEWQKQTIAWIEKAVKKISVKEKEEEKGGATKITLTS